MNGKWATSESSLPTITEWSPTSFEINRQGEGELIAVADPVHRMHPARDLGGEVLMEHPRQLVDAVDVDAQGECPSVFVICHLDDERQGQDVVESEVGAP
jgi:hypothetical protein